MEIANKKKIKIIAESVLAGFVICCLLFFSGPGATEHQSRNLKYILWKHGYVSYSPELALKFLNVDISFRHSLKRKNKAEIKQWFPDLRPLNNSNHYQSFYQDTILRLYPENRNFEFLWIGDSAWRIVFEKGKCTEFRIWKG